VKWVVPEPDSSRAIHLIRCETLGAPMLIFAEVSNALWRKRLAGQVRDAPGLHGLRAALAWTSPDAELADDALNLALELGHPVYDCFYLALAIVRDLPLMTADERFLRALSPTPHGRRVLRFADWAPA
jgi:predicted nucleic acid-binding protein